MPWWHVNTVSAPPDRAGGTGTVLVEVSNLGDAEANGLADPITTVDKLPAGISTTANEIHPEGGGGELARELGATLFSSCSLAGSTVTCTYGAPLLPYERVMIAIRVKVAMESGNGVNEVSVSGGRDTSCIATSANARKRCSVLWSRKL